MTSKAKPRLFPLGPLLEVVERRDAGNHLARGLSKLGRVVGADYRTVSRVVHVQGGVLTVRQADEWAIWAGYHPWEIWGDDWLDPEAYEEGRAG